MKNKFLTVTAALAFAAAASFAEQFTIFVYETKSDFAARTDPAKAPQYWKSYSEYGALLAKAGILRAGSALQAGATAKTVSIGKAVKNGAYAQAPHDLGGFFVIDVENLESAIRWAEKLPAAKTAAVEVRPTIPNPDMK